MTTAPQSIPHVTIPDLEAWAKSYSSEDIIGVAEDDCDCPLSRFYRTQFSLAVSVTPDGISAEGQDYITRDLYPDEKNVVAWVDTQEILFPDAGRDITAARFLEVLALAPTRRYKVYATSRYGHLESTIPEQHGPIFPDDTTAQVYVDKFTEAHRTTYRDIHIKPVAVVL